MVPSSQGSVSSTMLAAANALTALHTQPSSPCASPILGETGRGNKVPKSPTRDSKSASFPRRLMAMLSDPDASSAISWLPDGCSFVITSAQSLTLEVLPRYFGRTEFASFTRKLYWWGFKKTSRALSCDSFRHELFRRDAPELCDRMKGTSARRNRTKAAAAKRESPKPQPTQASATAVPGMTIGLPKVQPSQDTRLGPPTDGHLSLKRQLLTNALALTMAQQQGTYSTAVGAHPNAAAPSASSVPSLASLQPPVNPLLAQANSNATLQLLASRLLSASVAQQQANLPTLAQNLVRNLQMQQHVQLPSSLQQVPGAGAGNAQEIFTRALAQIQQQQQQKPAAVQQQQQQAPPSVHIIHVHHHRKA